MSENPMLSLSAAARKIVASFPYRGVFLTGIECSDPCVDGERRNQLKEAHDFYTHYKERLANIKSLGINWLRFGMPYSEVHPERDRFDFSFCDKVIQECLSLNIEVIADLIHFGVPSWMHAEDPSKPFFQNPRFPEYFAAYAYIFAKRYPHIRYFTPLNEPYVTAFFSAKIGIWNEQIRTNWADDGPFVKAAVNIAKAAVLAKKAIETLWREEQRPDFPIFIQNESFELVDLKHPSRKAEADLFNLRKVATTDLIFGKYDKTVHDYLLSYGISEEEYAWFMTNGTRENSILGIDHYPTCVHIYEETREMSATPLDPHRLYEVTLEYWQRYTMPLLHTETNAWPDLSLQFCQETYNTISSLRKENYPLLGMAWYGDEYQLGWHQLLVGPRSYEETPVGLFFKGELQPVGRLFSNLAKEGLPPLSL